MKVFLSRLLGESFHSMSEARRAVLMCPVAINGQKLDGEKAGMQTSVVEIELNDEVSVLNKNGEPLRTFTVTQEILDNLESGSLTE